MDNKTGATEMKCIHMATKQEADRLRTASIDFPELKDEFINQGYGVFSLWMNLAGYTEDEENRTIAAMRDYCTKW